MIVRVRRKHRKHAGVIPEQRLERLMWLVWVPLVVAWIALPYLAATRSIRAVGDPAVRPRAGLHRTQMGGGGGWARLPRLSPIECWVRMGESWRMAVTPGETTELVTSGLYAHIRHPIYALSIVLMLCSAVVVPDGADARRGRDPRRTDGRQGAERGAVPSRRARRPVCTATAREPAGFSRASAGARSIAIGRDDRQRRGRRSQAAVRAARYGGARLERVCGAADGRTARRTPLGAVQPGAVLRGIGLDPATEERVLALDPERISERELQATLALAPAPRIINLHGSVPLVTMRPFAEFLIAMGYPPERLRNPRDGAYSYSSFTDSRQLAGMLAWHYEREGMVPMLIGHSQGGMLTMKVLQDLAGASGDPIAVWNPLTDEPDGRFVDRRSRDRCSAAGRRAPGALRDRARDRQRHARAARPVGHAVAAAERPGHGRRVHRLLHRVGPDRRHASRVRRRATPTGARGRPRSAT